MLNSKLSITKSKIGKDFIITFASQLIIMLTFFFVNKLLSNSLGVDGYGQYSLIKKNSAVLSMIMLAGMGIALPRFYAYYKGKSNELNSNLVALNAIIIMFAATIIVFISGIILYQPIEKVLIGENNNAILYSITFIYSFSITLSIFLYSYYRGTGDFKNYNLTQIIVQLIILVSCFFAKENLSNTLIIWSGLTLVYSSVVLIRVYRKIMHSQKNNVTFKLLQRNAKELIPYGFTRLLGDIVLFSFSAIPLIYTNSVIGIKSTAYFSVGIMISNMITPLFGLLGMVLLPYVSEHTANDNHKHIRNTVNKLVVLYLVLSVFGTLLIDIFVDYFIKIFFNSEYLASKSTVVILIWTIVAQSIYLLLRNPLDAVSKIPLNTINLAISFLLMIVLFAESNNIIEFSYSFLIANVLLGVLSLFSWYIIYPKYILNKPNQIKL